MKRAIVIRNIVDLNAEPLFHSERKSQLLFGERVSVLSERGGYSEIEQLDGYRGWAPSLAFREIDESDWSKLEHAFALRINSPVAEVLSNDDSPVAPYFLSYGSTVYPAPTENDEPLSGLIEIASPDNLKRFIRAEDLAQVPAQTEANNDFGESLILSAMQFLGIPYLWGGRSSLGLDCSGLPQLVCSLNGVELPRDSCDQSQQGKEIDRKSMQTGDLIFLKGHVAIYMGDDSFLHASQHEGGVTINSFDPKRQNYRKDIDDGFQLARRLR